MPHVELKNEKKIKCQRCEHWKNTGLGDICPNCATDDKDHSVELSEPTLHTWLKDAELTLATKVFTAGDVDRLIICINELLKYYKPQEDPSVESEKDSFESAPSAEFDYDEAVELFDRQRKFLKRNYTDDVEFFVAGMKEQHARDAEEIAGLKRMIKTINDRVIPGEIDSTDSFRQIVDEHRKLTEEIETLRNTANLAQMDLDHKAQRINKLTEENQRLLNNFQTEESIHTEQMKEACERIRHLEEENQRLTSELRIAKKYQASLEVALKNDLRDNDAFGCEFVFVNICKDRIKELEKENAELSKEPLLVYGRKIDVLRETNRKLTAALKKACYRHHTDCGNGICHPMCPVEIKREALASDSGGSDE